MRTAGRVGVVLAGYVLAPIAAWAVVALWASLPNAPGAQASSDMCASGDALRLFGLVAAFALVPTALALRWLRPVGAFWAVLAILALLLSASGLYASLWLELDRLRPNPPRAADGTIPDLARMRASDTAFAWLFTTPVTALGSAFAAIFAPAGRPRRGLVAAALLASAVLAFSLVRTYSRPWD